MFFLIIFLFRFYEPVEFQPNIIPVCVPDDDEDLVGKRAWVTGWGRLYEGKIVSDTMSFYFSACSFFIERMIRGLLVSIFNTIRWGA